MYPTYTHDSELQHIEVARRAVEGDVGHSRIQRGSWNGPSTTGQTQSIPVTFSESYSQTPSVYVSLGHLDTLSSRVNLIGLNPTTTGFTLQVYSDTAQNITVNWFAIGSAE